MTKWVRNLAGSAIVLGTVAMGPAAQAYPAPNPQPPGSNVEVQSGPATPSNSLLPSTGGPDALVLGGALVLLVAGGAVVATSRRRRDGA